MKLNVLFGLICLLFYTHSFAAVQTAVVCSKSKKSWLNMTREEQADVLGELEYMEPNDLPENSKVVSYADRNKIFKIQEIKNKKHKAYIQKAISIFDENVSREEIEQSHYQKFGEEIFTGIDLLVSCDEKSILGATIYKYQDGRDENGQPADINWSVAVRFNSKAEILLKENGQPFDGLFFEWSGH